MSEIGKFSRPGEPVTDFEIQLLERAPKGAHWVAVGQRLVTELGRKPGAIAWAILMDEMGGEKAFVPSRHRQFLALWRAERNELVLSLSARPDWTDAEIARQLRIDVSLVRKIRSRDKAGRLSQRHLAQGKA